MQPWAQRIHSRLLAGKRSGLSQTGLAKACGISQPSVNQWFNDTDSKPATEMIRGDNLISASQYLGLSPEWIMTGRGASSQSERLPPAIIIRTVELTRDALAKLGKPYSGPERDPELFAEMLRLAVLEQAESGDGERGIWTAGGSSSGTAGTKSKAKTGHTTGSAASGRRKRA